MMRTALSTFAALLFVAATSARPAEATTPHDNLTHFSFSQPVAIPGGVLPAGDYIFRLADPDSGRHIVQVIDRHTGEVHGLFFTRYTERGTLVDAPEVTLGEAPAGMTKSIAAWWYPGTTSGREFVYAPGEASWDHSSHNSSTVGD